MKYAPSHTPSHSDTFEIDDIEYECFFEIEPAQRGGMIDPSWDAHCYDLVVTLDGNLIEPGDLDEEGFDYCFTGYSNWEEIEDVKFQELRAAYVKSQQELEDYNSRGKVQEISPLCRSSFPSVSY